MTDSLLFDTMIFIYALSLLFYFSDFVNASRRAKRTGTGLLIFVWVLQTAYLLWSIQHHADWSLVSRFEYMLFFSWLLVTVSLTASRLFRVELLVFFVNAVGFAVLTINLFSSTSDDIPLAPWELVQELLYAHIGLVLFAYAAFTFAAVFSGMYLFLHGRLKDKVWSATMRRLPSLENIEAYTFRAVLIGTPLFLLSLTVAVTSLIAEGRAELLLDWKVFSSAVALLFYVSYVVKRIVLAEPGWRTAKWNLLSYAALIINLFLNSASQFHYWS